ncbi:PIG-L family deacetylase [Candidatus Dependentiae bacterium]|nr:PIG-L family deacetylase [Candidatus Dependentiae bacterium]MBU4387031.1 PIG-L family deacetylase [Candidatus Dependentiae bacterium]MCG2756701.1 hypothetical protein [Candidatus Dependentiae bacterium]
MLNFNFTNSINYFFDKKTILHTSPHPDDVTLGYLPYINWLLKNTRNKHNFLIMTSGSNAVRNSYLENILEKIKYNLLNNENNNFLEKKVINNLVDNIDNSKSILLTKIEELLENLKQNNVNAELEFLKGIIREAEEESVWNNFKISNKNVIAFRANFYRSKTEELSQDINNFYKFLLNINPDIITVAIDPKNSAPLTHYKTFKVIQNAVKLFSENLKKDLIIIGYRNVWCQFLPQEANIFFPVTNQDFDLLKKTFINCYKTQVDAMYPSSKYSGNFADIAVEIMKNNLINFNNKFSNKINYENIHGLCFLKQMNIKEFINLSLDY